MYVNSFSEVELNVFQKIEEACHNQEADKIVKVGDRLYIPELNLPNSNPILKSVEVNVIDVKPNEVFFNFEEILFLCCIKTSTKDKGESFEETPLGRFLNEQVRQKISQAILVPIKDCGLLTAEQIRDLPFFKNVKNKIKAYNNKLTPWWTSTINKNPSLFKGFSCLGNSSYFYADRSDFGASPCFYIR